LGAWDDEQYFWSAADDAVAEQLRPFAALVHALPMTDGVVDTNRLEVLRRQPDWPAFRQVMVTNAAARALVESGAAQAYLRGKVRRPSAGFGSANRIYKRSPWSERPHAGDTMQVGFDWVPGTAIHRMISSADLVPAGFQALPDTDFEYAVYGCRDGGAEVWRYLAPGVGRAPWVPRRERAVGGQGVVERAECVVVRSGSLWVYEMALPWSEFRDVVPRVGLSFGLVVRVNDDCGPPLTLGEGKSAVTWHSLSLHPQHEIKPGCGVQWVLSE
jgi:hypothetical protein